jgi:hypothetical protein
MRGFRRKFVAALFIAVIVVATAHADCNDTNWTWPLCHVGWPSIPRYHMGGPLPPLTPKNSVWCTASSISTGRSSDGWYTGWYLISVEKHNIRFWPDYYHRTFVGIYWNGRAWVQTPQRVRIAADCDA